MRTVVQSTLVAVALSIQVVSAQNRPDFSGTWSLPPDAPLGPNGKPAAAAGFGPTINIDQEPGSIAISKMIGGQAVHVTHPLNGSETRSRTTGRLCTGDSQSAWTAEWKDDGILMSLVGSIAPGALTTTKMDVQTILKLRTPDTMAVEVTFRNPGMTEARTTTTIYKKTGPPSAIPAPVTSPVAAKIGQIEWLGGTWIGTTGASEFEERWTPPAGGSMLAVARSLRNGIMTSFEFLCIAERSGGLVYQAMPNGRQPATEFTLTRIEPNSLTFENPAHDFPKMIKYTLAADGTLEAVVSGTAKQKPLTFRFRRQ